MEILYDGLYTEAETIWLMLSPELINVHLHVKCFNEKAKNYKNDSTKFKLVFALYYLCFLLNGESG